MAAENQSKMVQASPHHMYDNFIIEDMLNELLTTNLNAMNLMTVNTELAHEEGTIKKVLVYEYEGEVEPVAYGEGNKTFGKLAHTSKQYEVAVEQHTFKYADEDVYVEPKVVEYGIAGAAKTVANWLNKKYMDELLKASLVIDLTVDEDGAPVEEPVALDYDIVVDALTLMETNSSIPGALAENAAEGAFLLINPVQRKELRKDPEFKAAAHGEMLFTGQIGQVAGLPIIVSNLVPKGMAFVATRKAVTCFIKKESQVEQARDIETRMNTVVMRKVNLVALTDASQVVAIKLEAQE